MNDRLQQLLALEGLSPAQFAEAIGINRSGISHLLSGRNNPSFEFIQKVMTVFPNLSPEWLILGKGKAYKDKNDIPEYNDLPVYDEQIPEAELFDTQIEPSELPENPKFNPIVDNDRVKSDKYITRITVYFSDGTFEDR